ncbi:ion transporter [Methylophaga sp. OBS4]|uniref:ion transporter n=1 Tax=Methylophaga sp. OBS4 TaxID=2991935 RepID=UPI002259E662|nr:ion transporter [Methylophaga sp. OBS4]MCX4186908.1 ion transporter [Methylophaga sp. OBS4]
MKEKGSAAYQLFMLSLSIYVLIALFIQEFIISNSEVKLLLQYVDFAVCLFFLADFFINFYTAESKRSYMKWGWIDLLASIPMLDPLRWGRIARIVRVIRFLRAIKSVKLLLTNLNKSKLQSLTLSVILITFVTYTIGSALILEFESQASGAIKTANDALWWSFLNLLNAKMSIDQASTHEGMLITVALNKIGLLVFAYLNAMIIAWLLNQRNNAAR